VAGKRSLYQALGVREDATAEAIEAAYKERAAGLADAVTAEDLNSRTIAREAYEVLREPVRRKSYDERLRDERIRALSSGMEEDRKRPANAGASLESIETSPKHGHAQLMYGSSALILACVVGLWVYFDHTHKIAAQRLEAERVAAEAKRLEDEARRREEMVNWSKDRSEASREVSAYRQRQAEIERSRNLSVNEAQRQAMQAAAEDRRKQAELRSAELQRQREEQENLRRAQIQLERERRYLRELEQNRPHKFWLSIRRASSSG